MGETPGEDGLSAAAAFRMVAEAACRDGKVDEWEGKVLNGLIRRLRLPTEDAKAAVVEARRAATEASGDAPMEAYPLYREVLRLAFADQKVDDEEQKVLSALRELLEIDEDDHMAAITELGLLPSRGGASVEGAAEDPDAPPRPPVETEAERVARLEAEAVATGVAKATFLQVTRALWVFLVVAALVLVAILGGGLLTPGSRSIQGVLTLIYLAQWFLTRQGLKADPDQARIEVGPVRLLPFDLTFLPLGLVVLPVTWGLWVLAVDAARSWSG